MSRAQSWLKAVFLALLWFHPNAKAQLTAADAFAQLSSLVGNWEGKFASGRAHSVSYRLTAAGTVLIETWSLAPGRESLTLYHMDGDNLIATHYCPLGNQPRLQLKPLADVSHLLFDFQSATNLVQPARAHQHQFEIKFLGPDSFWRSETYLENGEGTPEAVTYERSR